MTNHQPKLQSSPRPRHRLTPMTLACFLTICCESTNALAQAAAAPIPAPTKVAVVTPNLILPWNAPATWSPLGVPGPSDQVLIPAESQVAMNGQCFAAGVQIRGTLEASPMPGGITANWILASGNQGRFRVGTANSPFPYDFTIRLNAEDPDQDIGGHGTKFLVAMDEARIDLHGNPKQSWTKLVGVGQSNVGQDYDIIQVTNGRNWAVDDFIVIAYTKHVGSIPNNPPTPPSNDHSPQSHVAKITQVGSTPGQFYISPPIDPAKHCHAIPTPYHTASGRQWNLDQRAEVGMLSHNIVVTGAKLGSPTGQAFPKGFGAHVMLMNCCPLMNPGKGYFSNVEFSEVGQRKRLGRYPLHWHMQVNLGTGQYAKNCSIHHSYNRAMTIHGSHELSLLNNVCYDIEGHAVFLEDGVEERNTIADNLVLAVRRPTEATRMLIHDHDMNEPQNRSPASFWISNPRNTIRGNVAADSTGCGYWFALHTSQTGLSSSTSAPSNWAPQFAPTTPHIVNATRLPLMEFFSNTAHSMKMGVDVHDSIYNNSTPLDPKDDIIARNIMWAPPSNATMSDLLLYGCGTGIYTGGGAVPIGTIEFTQCVLADNGAHVQLASMDSVTDSLFVRDSGNGILPSNMQPYQRHERGNAYVTYDGPGSLMRCHFVGFDSNPSSLDSGRQVLHVRFGAARRHTGHNLNGLSFASDAAGTPTAPSLHFHSVPAFNGTNFEEVSPRWWGYSFTNPDGSLFGSAYSNRTLLSKHPMTHILSASPGTTPVPYDHVIPAPDGDNAVLSAHRWGHLQVRYYGETSNPSSILANAAMPQVEFERQTDTYYLGAVAHDKWNQGQVRQIPVAVFRPGSPSSAHEFTYAITTTISGSQFLRMDVTLDDVSPGDSIRLIVKNVPSTASVYEHIWSTPHPTDPLVFLTQLHQNGILPPALATEVIGQAQGPHDLVATSWFRVNNGSDIDLRIISQQNDPVGGGRTRRVTIRWQ